MCAAIFRRLGRQCSIVLQGYKFIQKPGPVTGKDADVRSFPAAGGPTVSGLPVIAGGRAKQSIFPAFPQVLPFWAGWSADVTYSIALATRARSLL